jgi:hypothetical protein
MCLVWAPQTRGPITASANSTMRALWRHMGSYGMKIWGRRCPTHGERAKPLDRVVAAAHFDCCVCVCGWFCVWEQLLATLLFEILHQTRQYGQLLHTHITKSAPNDLKYNWMCKIVIIQRFCTCFDILVQCTLS